MSFSRYLTQTDYFFVVLLVFMLYINTFTLVFVMIMFGYSQISTMRPLIKVVGCEDFGRKCDIGWWWMREGSMPDMTRQWWWMLLRTNALNRTLFWILLIRYLLIFCIGISRFGRCQGVWEWWWSVMIQHFLLLLVRGPWREASWCGRPGFLS